MRYFIDSEFIDDGNTIGLISIGIVSSDGREYYAQSVEFDRTKASPWVQENVFPHLDLGCPITVMNEAHALEFVKSHHLSLGELRGWHDTTYPTCPWRTREQIRDEIKTFCDPEQYGKPELVGWCSSYDYVALCQLFGTMMDLPTGYPHYMTDLQYLLDKNNITDDMLPKQEAGLHNALFDAKHIKAIWEYLDKYDLIDSDAHLST